MPAEHALIGWSENDFIEFPTMIDSDSVVPKENGSSKKMIDVGSCIKFIVSTIDQSYFAQEVGMIINPSAQVLFLCKKLIA
jgi:hypothetical protein